MRSVDAATVTGRISVGGRADNTSGSISATGLAVNSGDLVNGGSYTNTSNAIIAKRNAIIANAEQSNLRGDFSQC